MRLCVMFCSFRQKQRFCSGDDDATETAETAFDACSDRDTRHRDPYGDEHKTSPRPTRTMSHHHRRKGDGQRQ